ncbi:phosphoheptose isomerase [Streptomyces hygroscopicus subsp. jinggangensis 5008]|nr:phosphoheptose isomerase [Streptomyces hygroscopicus subsp. jinggangensis 5008]AGF61684.1 phosphoheptose isomerase [Streptomyces hygroscopicus subsp. jinggangensis TL01]
MKSRTKAVTDTAHGNTATATTHCDDLAKALEAFRDHGPLIERWGTELARRLGAGARLLVAGNGGSAAQAQHLTAELVGRYRDDRPPFSAVALHADTSSTTAIANDYGVQEVFARQTAAHGRPGDVLLLLSTSGASANLLAAADRAHRLGMTVWALTGRAPNPLQLGADDALCVDAPLGATVQELHLVAVHMLCEAFDQAVDRGEADHWTADTGADDRADADADTGDGPGADGRPGVDGRPSADGGSGADGRPGVDGRPGTDGRPGVDGKPGVVGRLVGRARTVGRAAPGAPAAPRKGHT